LTKKLEHELQIKILAPPEKIDYPKDFSSKSRELTFGDIVKIRGKDQSLEQ